jgi:hypothetical protein
LVPKITGNKKIDKWISSNLKVPQSKENYQKNEETTLWKKIFAS